MHAPHQHIEETHSFRRPPARSRAFTHGRDQWTVWEDFPAASDAEKPSLVFESAGIARRVHAYPSNWHMLSDEELHALSWQR